MKWIGGAKSYLGLDIGSHSIKLVEVKESSKGAFISAAAIARIENQSDDVLKNTLSMLISQAGIRSKQVTTAISTATDDRIIIRPIFMPELTVNIPEEELKNIIKWEAVRQEYIPYSVDESATDAQIIGEKTIEGQSGIEVFFVAAPKNLIEHRVKLLQDVGLIPIAIDIEWLALIRLLSYTGQISEDDDVAVIDSGAEKTSIGFLHKGEPFLYPDIACAGNHLTEEISQKLRMSLEEAEMHKHKERMLFEEIEDGLFEGAEDGMWQVSETIEDIFEGAKGLYPQIQEYFNYHEVEYPDHKPTKVCLAGGTSQLNHIDKFLRSKLHIPVRLVKYLHRIPTNAQKVNDQIKNKEQIFAIALGLALRHIQVKIVESDSGLYTEIFGR